jgi:hypothetical protein
MISGKKGLTETLNGGLGRYMGKFREAEFRACNYDH